MSPHFDELCKAGRGVIMVSISSTCKRLKSNQMNFISKLKTAWGHTNENLVLFISKLGQKSITKEYTPRESGEVPTILTFTMDIYGSMILQNMLQFHKPTLVTLLSLHFAGLVNLFIDIGELTNMYSIQCIPYLHL